MTTTEDKINENQIRRKSYANFDDNELLILIGENRDRLALAELYDRYRLLVGRFLQRKMCDSKLIDEVFNDVMLTVWNKATSFRGDSKVSTWIFGIAYRIRLTHSRKENRHRHSGTDELMLNIESEDQADKENQAFIRETIHAALIDLSEQHRSVIELAYFHGYSTQEISTIVGCPQNTVKTRLFHARKKLKAAIEIEHTVEPSSPINDKYEATEPPQTGYFLNAVST